MANDVAMMTEGYLENIMYIANQAGRKYSAVQFNEDGDSNIVLPAGNLDTVYDLTISFKILPVEWRETSILRYNPDEVGLEIKLQANGQLKITLPQRSATDMETATTHITAATLPADVWTFVTIVYSFDIEKLTIYFNDNANIEVFDVTQQASATIGDVLLGSKSEGGFVGALSCLQIYDTAYEYDFISTTIDACDPGI